MKIFNGKLFAEKLNEETKTKIEFLTKTGIRKPCIATIAIDIDEENKIYQARNEMGEHLSAILDDWSVGKDRLRGRQ